MKIKTLAALSGRVAWTARMFSMMIVLYTVGDGIVAILIECEPCLIRCECRLIRSYFCATVGIIVVLNKELCRLHPAAREYVRGFYLGNSCAKFGAVFCNVSVGACWNCRILLI